MQARPRGATAIMVRTGLLTVVLVAALVAAAAARPMLETGAAVEYANLTLSFSGGLPFCSQCGTPSAYACSPDAFGATLGNVRVVPVRGGEEGRGMA
jgi:hypothetical protein